jgi:hypothetical protein
MAMARRAVLGLGVAAMAGTAFEALPVERPPLGATFLQLLSSDRRLEAAVWQERLCEWQALGVDTLYLQWLALDGVDLLQPGPDGPGAAALLDACATVGLRAHLGLVHVPGEDAAFIGKPQHRAGALAARRTASLAIARDALALAKRNVIAGWYLPLELNDLLLADVALRGVLAGHLAACAGALWQLTPDLPVTVSAYPSRNAGANLFAGMLEAVCPPDRRFRVLLQDTVGVGLHTPETILPIASAVASLAARRSQQWGLIVEVFTQVAGLPVDDQPFAAVPAPLERIRAQLEVAGQFPNAERIAFAIPHYMAASAGPAAAALATEYREKILLSLLRTP